MSADSTHLRQHEADLARGTANSVYTHTLTPTQRQDEVILRLPEPQSGLAVYPLRYAVTPMQFDQLRFANLAFGDYPEADGFHVGLRELRPHAWFYVLYTEDGAHRTRRYWLTEDAQFQLIDDDGLPRESSPDSIDVDGGGSDIPTLDRVKAPQPFASIPLPTPERAIGPVCWLLTCDTELTADVLDRLARDDEGLRSHTATEIRVEGGADQQGAFDLDLLGSVPGFEAGEADRIAARGWSESRPETYEGDLVVRLCERRRDAPSRRYPPIGVALHDPVGVMSEFGHLTGTRIQALTDWLRDEQVTRKVMVSDWIDELGRQRARAAELKAFSNDAIGSAIPAGAGGGAANAARDRAYKAGIRAQGERLSFARNDERREFMSTYEQRRQELVDAIGVPAAAANAMYEALRERHDAVLDLYDERDADNFICLRRAVTYSLSVLACDPQGRQTLESMLPPEGPQGQMRRAMMGYPLFESLIEQATGPSVQTGAVAVGIQANKVLEAAAHVPPDDASRYLGMVTAALAARGSLASPEAFERSLYFRAFQLMDGELVEQELVKRSEAGKWLLQRNGGNPVNGFRPVTVGRHANEMIRLYRSDPVQEHLREVERQAGAVRQSVHFWQGVKFGFGAFGMYMGTRNLHEVMRNLGQEDGMTLANSLSLASGLLVAGSGTAALGEAGHQWRQGVEATRGRTEAAAAAKATAELYGNFAVGLLALSAFAVSVKDLFSVAPAAETASESAGHVAGATLQLASATVGGLHLLGRLETQRRLTDFVRPITSGIATGMEKRGAVGAASRLAFAGTRLGSGPVGWTLLALEAAYVAVKAWNERTADEAKVTTWIARSIWGTGERPRWWRGPHQLTRFTELEEMTGFYMFFQSPHVESDKDVLATLGRATAPGMIYNAARHGSTNPASRTVTIALPGWQPQVSRFEVVQHREFKVTGESARYDDPNMVTVRNGVGYISYSVDNWGGDIEVKYWPNAFAQPDVVLTAEDT